MALITSSLSPCSHSLKTDVALRTELRSPLLQLPSEIRLQIYAYVFDGSEAALVSRAIPRPWWKKWGNWAPPDISVFKYSSHRQILLTCKTCYYEGRLLFTQMTHFNIGTELRNGRTHRLAGVFLLRLSKYSRTHLTILREGISSPTSFLGFIADEFYYARLLHATKQLPSLQTCIITVHGCLPIHYVLQLVLYPDGSLNEHDARQLLQLVYPWNLGLPLLINLLHSAQSEYNREINFYCRVFLELERGSRCFTDFELDIGRPMGICYFDLQDLTAFFDSTAQVPEEEALSKLKSRKRIVSSQS